MVEREEVLEEGGGKGWGESGGDASFLGEVLVSNSFALLCFS